MGKNAHRHSGDMANSLCWNCKGTLEEADLCGTCVKIQPFKEGRDYFDILGLPHSLVIDSGILTEKFHEKSRLFHPDFHRMEVNVEQEISLTNASRLNQAFKTLKDPFLRAAYYLSLQKPGNPVIDPKKRLNPQDLMELMELKEELESEIAVGHQEEAFARLEKETRILEKAILESMMEIDHLESDMENASTGPADPDGMIEILQKKKARLSRDLEYRKYIQSIRREILTPATVKETS
ncbi:Fe-S protein assembly co-chaperone HscB [Leptospirillum ferrooxidans]|uniref:HscB chaperone n=1 Tax=Leptospirillum ferrooxidans (strain C2-3) TaxID=1162668 RepID=I0IQH9_LEPFC|nr:Fe-S protein assembly co-chaperone HscB [Leptospirillum ferrooxidans]BAM07528.1 HscB chaperone [Leptospirillum ferrooxidans C2-3]